MYKNLSEREENDAIKYIKSNTFDKKTPIPKSRFRSTNRISISIYPVVLNTICTNRKYLIDFVSTFAYPGSLFIKYFRINLRGSKACESGEFGRVDHMIPWQIDHQQTIIRNLLNNYQPFT